MNLFDMFDNESQDHDGFYVIIASEEDGVFIGALTKDGGRWRESTVEGNPPYNWGGNFMSYLTSQDIMQHMRNDYGRHYEVKGPFFDDQAAMQYAQNHFDFGADDSLNEFAPGAAVATGGGKKDYGQPINARYIGGNKFVVGTTNNYILTATIDKYGLDWDDGWYLDSPGSAHLTDASEGEIPLPISTEQRHSIHDTVTDYLNDNNVEDLQKVARHFGHSDNGRMNEQGVSEGDVIHHKFGMRQDQKGKTPYYKNPDIEVPMYDPVRGANYIEGLSQTEPQPYEHFKAMPNGNKIATIVGFTQDGKKIKISTAPIALATVLADAYNRGGFTDVPLQRVPLGENEQMDETLTFMGSPCTKDCSGHQAGYQWSLQRNGRTANGWSQSFNNGTNIAARVSKQRPQGGGKLPGYQSQTTNAVQKRNARAASKAVPQQPMAEDSLNEFEMPVGMATGTAATTDVPTPGNFSVVIVGQLIHDMTAKNVWEALEAIFPRDYPRKHFQDSAAQYDSPQRRVLNSLDRSGQAIAKSGIASRDMAETFAAKFAKFKVPAVVEGEMNEDLPPPENSRKTQIPGTLPTYVKGKKHLDTHVPNGRTLDFGAGLGGGAAAMGADSYEPYPQHGFKPTYTQADSIPDNSYERVTNFNVLNVVPDYIRKIIVQHIGRVLAPGGVALITTRGKDVMSAKGADGPEPMSRITTIGTYQKGFSTKELMVYVQSVLGDGFEVSPLRLGPAGVIVRKLANQGVAEGSLEEIDRRGFLKGLGAAAVAGAAGGANADWQAPITLKDPMTDKVSTTWMNNSDDGSAYIMIETLDNGFNVPVLGLYKGTWSVPNDAQVFQHPETKHIFSRDDQNYVPGRLRIDNGQVIPVKFGGGPKAIVILSNLKNLGNMVAGAKQQILIDVGGVSNLGIVRFNVQQQTTKESVQQGVAEGWSQKYKSSINCSHPKGFSQKAHCAGKKKHNESIEMEMTCPDCGMCETHCDHENLDEACWKGYHKEGNKKMFGKTYPNCVKNEDIQEEKCPHCGGPMFSEMIMNEKKDACYYKVKSRYKVWPSAYASGALVKCRKKGASNWGTGGKSNESIEDLDENLHKWFKEKWVRFGPDGKIKGDCARGDDSEGKPKCLPQSKAHSLGKKGRASAAARKRREDPNPERSGKAINVNTKKKSNEDVAEDSTGSVEAYGYAYNKRDQRVMWRKIFPTSEAAYKWAESKNATVLGVRELKQGISEGRVYYNVIGTTDKNLRKDFGLSKDKNGWYLREDADVKKHAQAFKAFGTTKLKEYDLSAALGTTQTQGSDNIVSPVGSVPRGQIKR